MSRNSKSSEISSVKSGDVDISDPKQIAETLNDFFVNKGPSLANDIPPSNYDMSYIDLPIVLNSTFHFGRVTLEEIMKILKSIPNDKATGYDMLPVKLIKSAAESIIQPLTYIINQSLMTGNVPTVWKIARVTALHKGGPNVLNNFRPISILPVLSKILERVAFNQLYYYLNSNDLINVYQSGFRPLHSTETALLNTTDDWLGDFDNGNVVIAVMLDLTGAFDTIDHTLLTNKLYYYGLDEKSVKWFISYLDGRTQTTCISGNTSKFKQVTCGIPQGSILGPLLFIIYINDLPSVLKHCKVSMYADDTM